MMRSLFSGVAGLKTHQTKMDVIGNNIANVNTTAYKSQSITFSDLLYQTTQSASGANATTGAGGTNARQIGLGSKTGAISTAITTQGSAQSTSNPFDIMITGDSFFVVSNGSENFFTRDGSFCVDGMGNLVMSSTGYTVMGWQADAEGNIIQDTVSPLRIMSAENMTYPPEATSKAYVSGIVDKNDTNVNSTSGKIMSLSFYDDLGYAYNARFSIHAVNGDAGEYYVHLDKILDSAGNEIDSATGSISEQAIELKDLSDTYQAKLATGYEFVEDSDGNVTGVKDASGAVSGAKLLDAYGINAKKYADDGDVSYANIAYTVNKDGTLTVKFDKAVENAVNLNFKPDSGLFNGVGAGNVTDTDTSITLSFTKTADSPTAGNFSNMVIDFSNATMYNNNGTSTVSATSGDTKGIGTGRRLGEMSGVSIAKDGVIIATYDNGQNKVLGQVAVANFANAAGLEKAGDNLYSATANSGEFDGIGEDITANGNYMTTGVLEMSNVDLAQEFTDMITTQRGFQANSRIITVSDTLLEELTNLKR